MFPIQIYEDENLTLQLDWFGAGRSIVGIKARGWRRKSFPEEHRYFQGCTMQLQKLGVKNLLDDPRARTFYAEYCEAVACGPASARWATLFQHESPSEVAARIVGMNPPA